MADQIRRSDSDATWVKEVREAMLFHLFKQASASYGDKLLYGAAFVQYGPSIPGFVMRADPSIVAVGPEGQISLLKPMWIPNERELRFAVRVLGEVLGGPRGGGEIVGLIMKASHGVANPMDIEVAIAAEYGDKTQEHS